MNDRYLFKAKRADNGEWVQGALLFHDSDAVTIFNQHPADGSLQGFEVDQSTLCQCTGLKDKNGKLIWENDIINTHCSKAVVIWDKAEWQLKWTEYNVFRKDLYFWNNENNWKCEVIGNKFDNPELLESKEINNKETCATCRYRRFIIDHKYKNRTDIPCFLCKRNISDNRAVMYEPIC